MAATINHTRGPWTVGDGYVWHIDDATGMGYRFKPIEFNGGCLAWVADDDGDAEALPNARLIAAAPQLLAALDALVNSPNAKQNDMWDEARAAVAAAR